MRRITSGSGPALVRAQGEGLEILDGLSTERLRELCRRRKVPETGRRRTIIDRLARSLPSEIHSLIRLLSRAAMIEILRQHVFVLEDGSRGELEGLHRARHMELSTAVEKIVVERWQPAAREQPFGRSPLRIRWRSRAEFLQRLTAAAARKDDTALLSIAQVTGLSKDEVLACLTRSRGSVLVRHCFAARWPHGTSMANR